jgi:hypothetical protein
MRMGQILSFPPRAARSVGAAPRRDAPGELVAMSHVDIDVVIETVRVLRTLGEASPLDAFNRPSSSVAV